MAGNNENRVSKRSAYAYVLLYHSSLIMVHTDMQVGLQLHEM